MNVPEECEVHDDDVMVVAIYDQRVIGYNPKTKQHIRPPRTLMATCHDEDVGPILARVNSLNQSTGWLAEVTVERLFADG